jgi:hypothetical protein
MGITIETGARTIISAVLAMAATLVIATSVNALADTSLGGGQDSGALYAQQGGGEHLVA